MTGLAGAVAAETDEDDFVIQTNPCRRLWLVLLVALALPACQDFKWPQWTMRPARPATTGPVPYPVTLVLPKTVSIHPFTGMRSFDDAGGITGVDVRLEAKDSYGDTTRAFGDFHFELYTYRPNSLDAKDTKIASWDVPLTGPKTNLRHWDSITRTYQFRLQWSHPIPVGERFVLVATFSSPYTERLFAERVFVSGQ
ncbi:MAG: hypothetical protein MUP47_05945 [Phycisphaerae bacterium]|nr:hypothetical protein [Phycisphaerae bacterium]